MNRNRAFTATVVFKALSPNYGESVGNVSELKKLSHGGRNYSFMSRQALRHEFWRYLKENYNIDSNLYWEEEPQIKEKVLEVLKELNAPQELPPEPILHADNEVVQFSPEINAINCIEADLFGYMKTESGSSANTRSAIVKLSPAVALEPMEYDVEFGTNKNFADRAETNPNPFQFEHQYSLYTYTITADLDRLGAEFNSKGEKVAEVPPEEKERRLKMVLEAIKGLSREIKGRIENLSPLFIIGGFYPVKNPFFLGRVEVTFDKERNKFRFNTEVLKNVLELAFKGESVKASTVVGYVKGFWTNDFEGELERLGKGVKGIEEAFKILENEAEAAFKEARDEQRF